MAKNSEPAQKATVPERITVFLDDDGPETPLRAVGGSRTDRFNNALILAMAKTGWFPPGQSEEEREQQVTVSVLGLRAFKPADEIEGMLAAQAMAQHHASMECSRLAMVAGQPFEFAQACRKSAANASRTFVELLAALDRKRGKGGQQVVRVEHIHVHGGQAVVGNIAHTSGRGGGGKQEIDGEPHAPPAALAHDAPASAILSALRSPDAARELVSATGHAERQMPNARRKQYGA